MGNWYRVIKTIKGNRYLYEQQTFRENGRVKTLNRYLGRADQGSRSSGRVAYTAMREIHAGLFRGESAEAVCSLPSIAGAVTTTPNVGAEPVTSVPRHWKDYSGEDVRITDPQSAVTAFRDLLKKEDPIERDKEHYYVMHLDARSKIKMIELVHLGTLTSAVVHPRETFRRAIAAGSYAIIIARNHPSGEVEPSEEDIKMTKLMHEAGKIVGIDVRDHIVFSDTKAWSFQKNGEIV